MDQSQRISCPKCHEKWFTFTGMLEHGCDVKYEDFTLIEQQRLNTEFENEP